MGPTSHKAFERTTAFQPSCQAGANMGLFPPSASGAPRERAHKHLILSLFPSGSLSGQWPDGGEDPSRCMPSLFRFLLVVGIIGGIGYGVIFALATFVNPKPREITVTVPPDRFYRQR